jgi:hypothetical protein
MKQFIEYKTKHNNFEFQSTFIFKFYVIFTTSFLSSQKKISLPRHKPFVKTQKRWPNIASNIIFIDFDFLTVSANPVTIKPAICNKANWPAYIPKEAYQILHELLDQFIIL